MLSSGSAGDGKYVILGTSPETNETLAADVILAEDISFGTSADVIALAYRKGTFNKTTVKARTDASNGSAVTITAAHETALRDVGIYMVEAQTV